MTENWKYKRSSGVFTKIDSLFIVKEWDFSQTIPEDGNYP